MKIENLKEGMVIKNYKELCGLLDEKVKTGNAKQYQMKDFKRYCKFHKDGFKFIIDKIFDKPKAKIDPRFINHDNFKIAFSNAIGFSVYNLNYIRNFLA